MALILKGQNLSVDQILIKYLTPRLRFYYFWFLKTDFH